MALRVLVCGGRKYDDRKALGRALREIVDQRGIACIIHGGMTGADYLAKQWARHNGVPGIEIEAQWSFYGRKAGPLRNGWMIEFAHPNLVVAFPGGDGTKGMVEKARAAAIEVLIPIPFGDGHA